MLGLWGDIHHSQDTHLLGATPSIFFTFSLSFQFLIPPNVQPFILSTPPHAPNLLRALGHWIQTIIQSCWHEAKLEATSNSIIPGWFGDLIPIWLKCPTWSLIHAKGINTCSSLIFSTNFNWNDHQLRNPSYDNTEMFMTTTSELHSLGIRVLWDPGIPGHIHTFIHNDTGPAIGPFDIFDVTFDPWKNAKKRCWKLKKNAVNFIF